MEVSESESYGLILFFSFDIISHALWFMIPWSETVPWGVMVVFFAPLIFVVIGSLHRERELIPKSRDPS